MAVMIGVTRMTGCCCHPRRRRLGDGGHDGEGGIQSGGLRRPAPSFSSLLGNPVKKSIVFRFIPSAAPFTLPRPTPVALRYCLCFSGFPSPQSSQPMAVRTGVTRMTARLSSLPMAVRTGVTRMTARRAARMTCVFFCCHSRACSGIQRNKGNHLGHLHINRKVARGRPFGSNIMQGV